MSIAIIGAGPRGIAALQSLASKTTSKLSVHLFGVFNDNGEFVAGQGTPFHVGQPHFSRLNARSAVVDHFAPYRPEDIPIDDANPSDEVQALRGEGDGIDDSAIVGADFDTWARDHGEEEWVNEFPPRAIIGDYLTYCAHYIIDHLPENIDLTCYGPATSVSGTPGEWTVESGSATVHVTDLLLTVGHAQSHPNAMEPDDVAAGRLIDTPYPLAQLDSIEPGATVATRGAGLSFIDIALALTEGRGGTFSKDSTTYTPSGNEPAIIYPTGLEGIFLDAKPDIDAIQEALPQKRWDDARARLSREASLAEIMTQLRELASDALRALDYSAPKATFDDVAKGTSPASGQARAMLAESLSDEMPARTVVVGAIITVMEELLEAVANREFDLKEWADFSFLFGLVNSYGFGPPQANATKIMALIDAGIISTEWLDSGVDALELPEQVDVMVEGMLVPPGYWPEAYPALEPIADYLSAWADPDGRTGVRTNEDGLVLDEAGEPIEHLAAIGRITEDWVISTDSLNRSAHPYLENWAGRF